MTKRILFTILSLFCVALLLGGIKALQIKTMIDMGANMEMPANVISTSQAESQEWEMTLFAIGSLEAVQGITLTAEVPGRVSLIEFVPGTEVNTGDLLVQQDVKTEQSQLRAAESSVALAKSERDRAIDLMKQQAISQSQYDSAKAAYTQAVAQADTIRLTIAKKSIRAPFSGKLGIRMINLGQELTTGDAIVSLQAANPIFVNFYLPQRDFPLLALNQEVRVTTDAASNKVFIGKLTAISPEVDSQSRNFRVQATLTNDQQELLPGMFARVEVVLPKKDPVTVVPLTAVAYATYGDSVFVVEEQKDPKSGKTRLVATQQFVQLGEKRGDFVAIKKGIEAGTTIVSAGVFKLLNGAPVAVNNETRPKFSIDPNPQES